MRLRATKLTSISSSGSNGGIASITGVSPSLDLRFADNKSLGDSVSGQNLVTFSRASGGTYIDSTGTLQTAATNAPRFDHNPSTGESLGLLVEEQRTNSIRNNTMVGAVAGTPGTAPTNWVASAAAGITRQLVGVGTEDGISYIDYRLSGTATGSNDTQFDIGSVIAALSGQSWTSSVYVKLQAGSLANATITQIIVENSAAGGFLAASTQNITPTSNALGQQRASLSRTLNNASTAYVITSLRVASAGAIDITLRIGMPQLEQGAFATSVIPTTTATATRSADVVSITGSEFSRWYRQDEGTLFSETQWAFTHTATVPTGLSSTWEINNTATSTNNYSILGNSATTVDQSQGRNPTIGLNRPSISGFGFKQAGVLYKTAFGWNPSVLQHSTNTLLSNASTNTVAALMATHDRMLIGQATGGSPPAQLNGTIRRLTFFPARLPNTTLQRLTQ
jgi:hypothetical protein